MTTTEEKDAALQQWLSDLKAGKFRKNRQSVSDWRQSSSDVAKVAAALEVEPPPLPLSPEGQGNAEIVLREPIREKASLDELERSANAEPELSLTSTRRKILALVAWADDQPWPNRSGTTDLHAYRAFLATGFQANKLLVGMSQYELAEQIGVSNRTAWLSTRRLEGRRLIGVPDHGRCPECRQGTVTLKRRGKRARPFYGCNRFPRCDYAERSDVTLALEYLLLSQEGERNYVTHLEIPSFLTAESDAVVRVPDAFRTRQGLGKGELLLLDYLQEDHPQMPSGLAKQMHRDVSTVRRHLRELGKYELARKVEGGWIGSRRDLDAAAVKLGTAGATVKQRRYNEEVRRPGFRAYLKHKEDTSAASALAQDVQAREGAVVSTAREAVPTDGRAAIPERGTQPLPSDHGRGVSPEPVEGLGHDPADLLTDNGARQSVGGMAVGNRLEEREAACLGCGQVQTFSAPDLRPYSCAHCKGKFEFVDKLAMVAA